MDCSGGSGLNNKRCLTGILKSLTQEFNVDSVILSHYIETKYVDDSMQVLRMIIKVLQNLDEMGIREPYNEYIAEDEGLSLSQKNQQRSICEKCPLKPEAIFSALKREFIGGLSGFYYKFDEVTRKVAAQKEDTCDECIKATEGDLIYIFNKLESFRAFVIHKGFQIVI